MALGGSPNMALADQDGTSKIRLHSLAGNVLAELDAPVSISIRDLKAQFKPHVAPDGSKSLVLTLFFNGAALEEGQTLKDLGLVAGDDTTFLALLFDVELLAQNERDQMYADAVARSRHEAEEARKARAARRQQLAAERQQAQGAQLSEEPQAMLMLAAEPANASQPAAAEAIAGEQPAAEAPLLMLAAEPANPAAIAAPKDEEAPRELSAAEIELAARVAAAKATREVEAAYDSFFDHISFRKGWRELPFKREEVDGAFKIAARVVATARLEVLNPRGEGIKLRQMDGSARDWMHDPAAAQLLRTDPGRFPAALVHATFRDGHGYVEGLCESEVDGFLGSYS